MDKKNLLFYIDTLQVGGIEKVLIELLKNLDTQKFNLSLVIGFNLPTLEKFRAEIPKNVEVIYLLKDDIYSKLKEKKSSGKLSKFEKIINEVFAFRRKNLMEKRFLEIVDKKNIDVVVDFDMTLASYNEKIKSKKIAFCHFSLKNYHRGIKSRQEKLFKRLENYDRLVVISDEMKKEAVNLHPNFEKNIIRIYNSFNIAEIIKKSQEEIEDIENSFILSVGRLEETQKDFTTLIKGYAKVCDRLEENLYIVGDGRHKTDLENLAKKLGISQRVKFLGFKSNPYPYMRKATVFVLSSKFEGLPTVMIEALILGKLIVATDCPTGPYEILDGGKNGILTRIENAEDIGNALVKMLIEKDKNEEFLKNSKDFVVEFDSQIVVKKFEEMIEKL